jgi:hypothetical protein
MREKKMVDPERPQMAIWRMRIARWIPKDTHVQNMKYCTYSFLHGSNRYAKAPQRYVYTYIVCRAFKINTGLHTKHDNAVTSVGNTCVVARP